MHMTKKNLQLWITISIRNNNSDLEIIIAIIIYVTNMLLLNYHIKNIFDLSQYVNNERS